MSDIRKNAISFLQKRFPGALVLDGEAQQKDRSTGEIIKRYSLMMSQDMATGIKQRTVAVENLGENGELPIIAQHIVSAFDELDGSVYAEMSNALKPKGHKINTKQMTYAPRIILYTNKLCVPVQDVIQAFTDVNLLIDVEDESKMHKTLFISYGGGDEEQAAKINKTIKSKGVKTWFFPDDALPGEKLHRVMHDGVNNHDRVLLICSKSSLSRKGVLNEIERVLEREAKEGGSDILLPVTIDDFVYSEWETERPDIADQVRSRVITKINTNGEETAVFEKQVQKIVDTLSNKNG